MPKVRSNQYLKECAPADVRPKQDVLKDQGIRHQVASDAERIAATAKAIGVSHKTINRDLSPVSNDTPPETPDAAQALQRKPGVNQYTEPVDNVHTHRFGKDNNVNVAKPMGNTAARALRKLRRDAPEMRYRRFCHMVF